MNPRWAYLCSDPGIGPDATKGAAVHFREFGQALRSARIDLDVFMARSARGSARLEGLQIVEPDRAKGIARELAVLAASQKMFEALQAQAPHDAVYERLSLFGVAGAAYAASQGIPFVVEVNAPLWEEARRYRSLQFTKSAEAMCYDVLQRADLVLVVSDWLRQALVLGGLPADKIRVVPNGVSAQRFRSTDCAQKPAVFAGRPTLLFLGSLKPWHGFEFLLEAFARRSRSSGSKDVGLWIVGDGPGRELVEAAASQAAQHIVYEGAVSHAHVPAILRASDVVALPYTAESPEYFSPLKAVEARAAGCRVVATGLSWLRTALGRDVGIHYYEDADFESFDRALEEALHLPNSRAELQEAAYEQTWECKARTLRAWVEEIAKVVQV